MCLNPEIKILEHLFQVEVDVHANGFTLNLYYVQTANDPFKSLDQVVKSDGTVITNDIAIFPPPQKGRLEGMEVEVQDQHSHIQDIFAKGGLNKPKYINDLKLLDTLLHSA